MSTEVFLYTASIIGINVFAVFFLLLTKWYKTFMGWSLMAYFVIISVVLDLSAVARFFPEETTAFITTISLPVLTMLMVSTWTLVASFIYTQFFRPKRKNGEVTKADVKVTKL